MGQIGVQDTQFQNFKKLCGHIFWGGLTKATTVCSRLPKNMFCENVPMSVRNDVVNIKTCLGIVIMWFCHFAKMSAPIQNMFGRTFLQAPPLNLPNFGYR